MFIARIMGCGEPLSAEASQLAMMSGTEFPGHKSPRREPGDCDVVCNRALPCTSGPALWAARTPGGMANGTAWQPAVPGLAPGASIDPNPPALVPRPPTALKGTPTGTATHLGTVMPPVAGRAYSPGRRSPCISLHCIGSDTQRIAEPSAEPPPHLGLLFAD
jgi:hypothetical protein